MDLELGLKITKTRDDIASISEYRLAKAGPIFQSRETNTMFILTAHLKGQFSFPNSIHAFVHNTQIAEFVTVVGLLGASLLYLFRPLCNHLIGMKNMKSSIHKSSLVKFLHN